MKQQRYELLLKQAEALFQGETNRTAVLANCAALIKESAPEQFFWVGFYLVEGNELILGPFQGPAACMHIGYGKGVCGTAWERGETLVVPDVEAFPGHIACSSASKSEIVVPVFDNRNRVVAVLDADSDKLNDFDDTDKMYLEKLVKLLSHLWASKI